MALLSVLVIGGTGEVGGHVVGQLISMAQISRLTLLGRRPVPEVEDPRIAQVVGDVLDAASYRAHLPGHQAAICTLGVGEPSKVTRETYVRIDRDAVLAFATECREAGVTHFELLSSVGADSGSRSFYLKVKGELEDGLRALEFERLSLFRPSMILTPRNRYGLTQAITLAIWPRINPLLRGRLRKYRGIPSSELGRAMAKNLVLPGAGTEELHWDEIRDLARR